MNFEDALRAQLKSNPDARRIVRKRVLAVLDAPKSKARTRKLERMERAAVGALGAEPIDWDAIDWRKVFNVILTVLDAILTLFDR